MLVSNETTQPTTDLVAKLHILGFTWVTEDDVMTPVPAVKDVIKHEGLNPYLVVHKQVSALSGVILLRTL